MNDQTDIKGILAEAEKAKKVNWDRLDTPIEHAGRAITLPGEPGKMPLAKAIEALQRKQRDEETMVSVHEVIEGHPFDGLVAFVKAMANLYGWSSPVPTPGMFGPKPPQMISVKTGHRDEDVVQCPHGRFVLPGIDNPIETHMGNFGARGQPALVIAGTVKKREKSLLLELANEARRILKEQSIYRGKAIRFGVDDDGCVDMSTPPEFLDVSDTTESSLLFSQDITDQIHDSILVPLKETQECRKQKVPLKRGILLEGPYGTGKSLTARMAAGVATQNGWTFILLDKVQGLKAAHEFANRYAPAVVFAEDIDRIASVRDDETNDLINIVDGVVSKGSAIMTILTTNFVEKINQVMLRPGRLDAVISLRAPDTETVAKLIRFYAGKLVPDDDTLAASAKELSGQIPASIRECVERAKLGMIGRKAKQISDKDIMVSAQTMKNHLALLNRDRTAPSDAEVLAGSLKKVIGNGTHDMLAKTQDIMISLADLVDDIHRSVC